VKHNQRNNRTHGKKILYDSKLKNKITEKVFFIKTKDRKSKKKKERKERDSDCGNLKKEV
jgi:hypothetical protein